MSRISSIGLSGMMNAVQRLNVVAHNLANIQTPGFKAQQLRSADVVSRDGQGLGVATLSVTHSQSPGPFIETGEWSHISVNGSGYFAVQDSEGKVYYTRNGSFWIDKDGFLVNDQGYRVLNSQGNPIPALDSTTYASFKIDDRGKIWGIRQNGVTEDLGADYQIGIATFRNGSNLISAGGTLYLSGSQSGVPDIGEAGSNGRGSIISGFLEGSNVSIEEEMVGMIMAKVAYTANSKIISTEDSMNKALLDIKT